MATAEKVCEICKLSDTDELNYGEWMTSGDCTIHYYCALLSSNSVQRGKDDEGILGFLVKDIRDLIELHKKTPCIYCKNRYATVRCKYSKCFSYFHVVCGVQKKCLFHFDDEFISYCHRHVEIQETYPIHEEDAECHMCTDKMGAYHPITSIPSCCNQGYYYKNCMQRYAISSGYKAHCPSCGYDADGYRKFLRNRGIFCPDKDQDWAADRSSEIQYKKCSAVECSCPLGKDHCGLRGNWKLLTCHYCGAVNVHVKCRQGNAKGPFECGCHLASTSKNGNKAADHGNIQTDDYFDMHKYRMDMFFQTADFSAKPPPLPWLV